ncbi:GAF domain-containing sensor histidine kinase [Pseudonocardia xishanensis]|uniref:Oxygen sensor histidine kinase NreB n=1 Tax=Pseudonocardia xishanensis TaxID=630995 RepID=A0ABP8S3T0_9PSEU
MCYMVTSIDDVRNLVAAARGLSGLVDLDALTTRAGRRMHALIGLDIAAISVVVRPDELSVASVEGLPEAQVGARSPRGRGLGWRAFELDDTPTASLPDSTLDDPLAAAAAQAGIRHLMACPVEFGGAPLGALYVGTRTENQPDLRVAALLWEFAASLGPLMSTALRVRKAGESAVLTERARIAHQLHDTAEQLLFGISLSAEQIRESVDDPAEIIVLSKRIEHDAAEVSQRLRGAMHTLLPPRDALVVAVRHDVERFSARSRIAAEAVVLGTPVASPDHVDEVVASVVSEGLHNVERHSDASSVMVTLTYRPLGLAVLIQDDGRGLPQPPATIAAGLPGKSRGLGLSSLRQRVRALGGTLDLRNGEDGGASLLVTLPLPDQP